MAKIRIQHFGPLKDNTSWIEIGRVLLLIGDQGSGKSVIAKLISTFMWIEKAINRGDHSIKFFERKSKFKNTFLTYHRIQNYLNDKTVIDYIGDSCRFRYCKDSLSIEQVSSSKELPQIMYVPAERNFLAYIESFKELKVSSPSLREFKDEYKAAQKAIKGQCKLPLNNEVLEYDRQNDILHLRGDGFKLRVSETSSGYQSLIPLYLVSQHLVSTVMNNKDESEMKEEERERFRRIIHDIANNEEFSDQQRREAISALSNIFKNNSFINIVEEPEQNLFPSSQFSILSSLLNINNLIPANKLIMTTHSPYIISYLTLFVKAHLLNKAIKDKQGLSKLNEIIPSDSHVDPKDLFIYEINEKEGKYSLLDNYKGMPSDDNYLNDGLAQSNEKFSQLLDLEDLCR